MNSSNFQYLTTLTPTSPTLSSITETIDMTGVDKRSLTAKILTSSAFCLMGVIGILGNALVIYAILKNPALRIKKQLSNMAILNLSITDFLTTSTVSMPAAIAVLYDVYPFSETFCKFCTFTNVTTICATAAFLAFVSYDRGRGIYPSHVTERNFSIAIGLIWIINAIVGAVWAMNSEWVGYDFWSGICDIKWTIFGPSRPVGYAYGWYCTMVHFILPTSVIIGSNVGIMRMAKRVRHVRDVKEMTGSTEQQQNQLRLADVHLGSEFAVVSSGEEKAAAEDEDNAKRILRSIVVIIVVYMSLTVPVFGIRIIKVLGGEDGPIRSIPPWVATVCTVLQFGASIVNPMIYGLFRTDFREAYRRILRVHQ